MEQLILSLAPAPPPSLDNFFAGANAGVIHALRLLAQDRGEPSIHLWGPAGSGRTHLLQAVAAAVAAAGGAVTWAAGAGTAGAGAGSAVAAGASAAAGRSSAAAADPAGTSRLVICDDVDELDDAQQLHVFAVIDAARREGSRILTAGLQPARELALRDDLRTRLAQSLGLAVVPLSDEQKRAAVAAHAADRGMPLAPEIVDYVTARVRRDMGTLMAVVDALDRYSLSAKRPLSVPLARDVLQRLEL